MAGKATAYMHINKENKRSHGNCNIKNIKKMFDMGSPDIIKSFWSSERK